MAQYNISQYTFEGDTYKFKDAHIRNVVSNLNIPTIATVNTAGTVKPDGTTISIDGQGTISWVKVYPLAIIDHTEDEPEEEPNNQNNNIIDDEAEAGAETPNPEDDEA